MKRKNPFSDPPTIKKAFTPPQDHDLPPPPVPLRGAAFTGGIEALAQGGNTAIYTQLDVPYRSNHQDHALDIHGTYSTSVQQSNKPSNTTYNKNKPTKVWTQGMLQPMGESSYFNNDKSGRAVPTDLSLQRARIEGRAMKFLADEHYVPTKKKVRIKSNDTDYLGGLTIGSYLEEITGARGLGFHGVGSGMRAQTMASKWKMKNLDTTSEAGFGGKMLAAYPQLGKTTMSPKLGASVLWDKLDAGGPNAKTVRKAHLGLGGSIYKAHADARKAAKGRFNAGIEKFNTDGNANNLGQWWKDKAGTLDLRALREPLNTEQRKVLRNEYVSRKMDRHGIADYLGPRAVAKAEFKGKLNAINKAEMTPLQAGNWWDDKDTAGANLGALTKAGDATQYKALKREYVVAKLNKSGFGADAVKAQATWAAKDKFAAKLNQVKTGTDPATLSKFWQGKVGTDFSTLDKGGQKSLQREYLAYRKAKI